MVVGFCLYFYWWYILLKPSATSEEPWIRLMTFVFGGLLLLSFVLCWCFTCNFCVCPASRRIPSWMGLKVKNERFGWNKQRRDWTKSYGTQSQVLVHGTGRTGRPRYENFRNREVYRSVARRTSQERPSEKISHFILWYIYISHIIFIFFDIILFKRVFPYQVHHLVRGILILRLEIGLHRLRGFDISSIMGI